MARGRRRVLRLMFCLDTNAVIAVIGSRPKLVNARRQSEVEHGTRIIVPAIVLHELLFGVEKSARRTENKRLLDQFLSSPMDLPAFDANDAADAAEIRAWLQSKGTPIGPLRRADRCPSPPPRRHPGHRQCPGIPPSSPPVGRRLGQTVDKTPSQPLNRRRFGPNEPCPGAQP